jgi:hypothetical protein
MSQPTGRRTLRPEILRVVGTLLAAIIIVIGLVLDLGTRWFLLAVAVYGISAALVGLIIVRNWRGMGAAHHRAGTIGYTGWVQVAIGSVMTLMAIIAFFATA